MMPPRRHLCAKVGLRRSTKDTRYQERTSIGQFLPPSVCSINAAAAISSASNPDGILIDGDLPRDFSSSYD